MKLKEAHAIRLKALALLRKAGIAVTQHETANIEVADFGLGDVTNLGLELIVYENNERYCAKELVLFPRQTCPEHRHPPIGEHNPGKQETFRCRWGKVYLYVEGIGSSRPRAKIPDKYREYFTVWREVILQPGQQFTIPPNTLHWFQAGPKGAIVSEFSSRSMDESDVWTDPHIRRIPVYE